MANSDSYFTMTNLLSSKRLTAVSFNITVGKEVDDPNVKGLEIHGKILHSFYLSKKSAALSFYSSKLLWTGSKHFEYTANPNPEYICSVAVEVAFLSQIKENLFLLFS